MADMYLSRRAAQRRWDGKTLRDDLAPGGDSFPTDGTTPVAAIFAIRCSRSSITCFWSLHIARGYATGGKQHWLPRTSAAACFRWHIDLHGLSSSLEYFMFKRYHVMAALTQRACRGHRFGARRRARVWAAAARGAGGQAAHRRARGRRRRCRAGGAAPRAQQPAAGGWADGAVPDAAA